MEMGAQFNWAKRDDVTQNTPPLVAAHLLVGKASSFGHKVGAEARCLAGWDCSVAVCRAPLDEEIVVIPTKELCPVGDKSKPWHLEVLSPRSLLRRLQLRLRK